MADILTSHVLTLFLTVIPPSLIADIILHPLDFATVLVQIEYFPDAYEKAEAAHIVLQYAVYSLYLPYLLAADQELQFMGLPAPSILLYIGHIYNKEGIRGCYRGLCAKILERVTMMKTYDIFKYLLKDNTAEPTEEERFLKQLVNCVCCQFFAVVASHPFHVAMIHSFADFTREEHNTMTEIMYSIRDTEGYYGFFVGLAPRVLGEVLSLIFSIIYTYIIQKQLGQERTEARRSEPERTSTVISTITNSNNSSSSPMQNAVCFFPVVNLIQHHVMSLRYIFNFSDSCNQVFALFPQLSSKMFYCMILRDILSKKISYPFFVVCHCMIVLDYGWEKLPLVSFLQPFVSRLPLFIPKKRCRGKKKL